MRVIGLAGWSGAGKTTVVTRVIPWLASQGSRISTVKHAHHDFDVDAEGKDSWKHRQAGATEVLVASARRWALMHELRDAPEPALHELLGRLSPVDLVIVEGYKRERLPKIEVFRAGNGKPPLFPDDPQIVAVATDHVVAGCTLPTVDIDDVAAIGTLMLAHAVPLHGIG